MERNKLLLLLVCFLGLQAMAKTEKVKYEDFLLRDSSRVICRTLDNGFRYFIQKQPMGSLQMSLIQKTGFLQDGETVECSHFIEHMMLTANRVMATGDTLRSYLNKLGMDYGMNFNAHTNRTFTKYDLVSSRTDEAYVDSCMEILSDIAGGASICAMDLEEQRERMYNEVYNRYFNVFARQADASEAVFLYGCTPDEWHQMRLDGTKRMTQSQLENFYNTWYQPQHQCLVLIGDVTDGVEDMIKRKFGSRPSMPTPAVAVSDFSKQNLMIERHGKAEFKIKLTFTQPLLTQSEKETPKFFKDYFALKKSCSALHDRMVKSANDDLALVVGYQLEDRFALLMQYTYSINGEDADGGLIALADSVANFLNDICTNGVQIKMPKDMLNKKEFALQRAQALKKLQEGDGKDNTIDPVTPISDCAIYSLPLYKQEDTDAYWSYELSGKDVSDYCKKFIKESGLKIECILPYGYPEREITEKLNALLRQYNN